MIFGADGLLIVAIGLVVSVISIWALVDSIARPSAAFTAAGSSKGMWIALIALFWLFTGIVGVILAIVYLVSIRPRVRAAMT